MKKYDHDIIELLDRLITNRSDSSTKYEKAFEAVILEEIGKIDYFKENPSLFGTYEIEEDSLGRSVVWALANHKMKKTVILFGHHDVVNLSPTCEIDGLDSESAKQYLKENMRLNDDVFDGEWLFGRGCCDMKAGLAINLDQLKKATEKNPNVNVLFLSVPDEETESIGMRKAINLLKKLSEAFELDYVLAVLPEPHQRKELNQFVVSTGSVGKMMPVIVTRGMPTHSGSAYCGLNSISITIEIVKAIELNTEMGDMLNKRMTPPPTFLKMFSIKESYDVTTPEFTVAYFNWLFLKDNLERKLEQLRELCKWSMEDAINQFNYSYNEYLRKQSLPSYCECMNFDFEILLYQELAQKIEEKFEMDSLYHDFKEAYSHLANDEFSIKWITYLIDLLKPDHPMVVIGLLPPFYPVVDSSAFFEAHLSSPIQHHLKTNGMEMKHDPYFMGISDMSYMKKMHHDPSGVLLQMPEYQKRYRIDLDNLDIEVLHVGPWGEDLHQKTERVFIKDVIETVPDLYELILETVSQIE